MGNWADRIDELESENFDLLEENRRLDDEVTDLLYEVDLLKDKLAATQEERDNLENQLDQVAHEHYLDWSRAEAAERRVQELERLLAEETKRADNNAWREFIETTIEAYYWRESLEITNKAYDEVQARANSWFEVAKNLVRSRDFWIEIADQEMKRADKAENTVDELKSALRVLGS